MAPKIPLIRVIDSRKNRLGNYPFKAYFYLEIDNWNDYSYYTSYHLHASALVTEDGNNVLVGHVRILKFGQATGFEDMLQPGDLEGLDEQYCSLANSLDYYERISQLKSTFRDRILIALRDCVIYPEIREEFKDEDGFRKSLMRNITFKDEIFNLAPLLISRDFSKLLDVNLSFQFSTPDLQSPVEFNFDSPTYGWDDRRLPNRISVIIGRNGSGKSRLLSRISRIAFSSTSDRKNENLKQLGTITPDGLGFPRIIFLSYSAFDSFATPGIYKSDKKMILTEMKNGVGRYIFCGIRDIVGELEGTIEKLKTDEEDKLLADDILRDKIENTKLKSLSSLAQEFVYMVNLINEVDKEDLFGRALRLLTKEKSMRDQVSSDWMSLSNDELHTAYMDLSTGHKFVIHAVASIVVYTEPRCLLLFDEPETHLHPPLLAVLMKAVRLVLNKVNAFMIVSTHSPVILQETLKQHVHVIQREGDLTGITKPDIETFGENTGILTQTAFGLNSEITDYHSTLDALVEEFSEGFSRSNNPETALDKIEAIFPDGLSIQARSYILSKLYRK